MDQQGEARATQPAPEDSRTVVAVLEPGLWRKLTGADGVERTAEAWAPLAAGMIDGATATAVMLARGAAAGVLRPVALWPPTRLASSAMVAAAELAVRERRGVVQEVSPGTVAVAAPLLLAAEDVAAGGAVVAEVSAPDQPAVRLAMRQLQWAAAWMRDALRTEAMAVDRRRFAGAAAALHAVVTASERADFETASRAVATDLAIRFGCDRVAIGMRRFGRTRVRAISHTARFGRQQGLVRLLANAMDEAVDQRAVLRAPPAEGDVALATHATATLARQQGAGHVLVVPLYAVDRFVGAATFERPAAQPFAPEEVETLEAAVTTLAPVLEEKRRNDRWLVVQAFEAVGEHLRRLLGPGRLARKLWVASALLLVAFFYFATGPYRVTADAVVEGSIKRAMAAPFDGFVAEAPARAGDVVAAGALMVRLDDRDLALERLRIVTERRRRLLEYERAVADRDRAEARVRQIQIEQADAELALIDTQIARAALRAPFDAVVVQGDLSQSIGAAVSRGQVLIEVAPLDSYRVVLSVDERAIADVVVGQTGTLAVAALPDASFPIRIEKITPVAVYGGGRTTFEVEASIIEAADRLLPGMNGAGRIDIDERRLIAIWTRPLLDWIKVSSWRWLPW